LINQIFEMKISFGFFELEVLIFLVAEPFLQLF